MNLIRYICLCLLIPACFCLVISTFSCNRNASNLGARSRVVTSTNGIDFAFPLTITCFERQWNLIDGSQTRIKNAVYCEYSDPSNNRKLRYLQAEPGEITAWSLELYSRDNSLAKWNFAEKVLMFNQTNGMGTETSHRKLDGLVEGPCRHFYPNGVIKMEYNATLPAHTKEGPASGYYPSGVLWWSGNFKRGEVMFDDTKFHNEEGMKIDGLSLFEKERIFNKFWDETTASIDTRPK